MRLNNKGFAISTIMYMVLVLAVLVMSLTLMLLNGRRLIIDKQKKIALNNIYGYSTPINFGGMKISAAQSDTHKGIVYLDPTNLKTTCDANRAETNVNNNGSPTGINSGCMRFYIFDDSGDSYKMILDHNTSGNVAWNSNGSNSMLEVAERLSEDTRGWTGNPRLITANEVAQIVGADVAIQWDQRKPWGTTVGTQSAWFYLDGSGNIYSNWQTKVANETNESRYAWLYDNMYGCRVNGCNIQDANTYPYPTKTSSTNSGIYGYWTSDTVSDDTDCAWRINRQGSFNCNAITTNNDYGVRPVITVKKNIINSGVQSSITLHSRVSFDANGGTLNGARFVYVANNDNNIYANITGNTTTQIPTVSRSGYTFNGWYTNIDAIDLDYTSEFIGGNTRRIIFTNDVNSANGWAMSDDDIGTHIQAKITVTDSNLTSQPNIDFNDDFLYSTVVEHTGNTWVYYADFDITAVMLSPRHGYVYTGHRFIDISSSELTASTQVSVDVLVKGGKKYYNGSGNQVYRMDITRPITLYAHWTSN